MGDISRRRERSVERFKGGMRRGAAECRFSAGCTSPWQHHSRKLGLGGTCDGCDESIEAKETYTIFGDGPEERMKLHEQCVTIWDEERVRPIRRVD